MSKIMQIPVKTDGAPEGPVVKNWFSWKDVEISPTQVELSKEVFGHPQVLDILCRAFSEKLSRDTGWDLSGVPGQAKESFVTAAKIYKRGVPFALEGQISTEKIGASHERKNADYNISIGTTIEDCFAHLDKDDIIIVDQTVADLWRNRFPFKFLSFDFSEQSKNIESTGRLLKIIRDELALPRARQAVIFVVGGGVAGDMSGFAAGFLGLPCEFVPTTLLSMVDSSVGGKVGVNFEPWGKNQIGIFSNPRAVFACPEWLNTLPEREFKSGLAEALKHALISGHATLWRQLVNLNNTSDNFAEILRDIIQVKASVVAADPYEQGRRVILNFGHTLGHVIETMATRIGKRITHGECVAIGMVHALRLSQQYEGMESKTYIDDILAAKIIGSSGSLDEILGDRRQLDRLQEDFRQLLGSDKKSRAGADVSFVLLKAPGKVATRNGHDYMIGFTFEDAWRDIKDTFLFLKSKCG